MEKLDVPTDPSRLKLNGKKPASQPRTQGCLSTTLAQGIKCLILIGRSKRNPRSKILESRQINIANTNFRALRQSNKRRIIIVEGNCFPRTTDASEEVHEQNGPSKGRIERNTFQLRIIQA